MHGRNDGAKATVARFVETLGIKATILHEQPSSGLTIIEKIEKYAEKAGFAIVMITPDDLGSLKDYRDEEPNPRARQNVVFELGYFMGKLGSERVCPLFKGEVEKPSDIDGIVYVPMDTSGGWKLKLAQEMKQAGLPIDMNKLL
ncbi:MAG: nucleotide-binding protein [Candidatus Poribacteria bacterium]|nr:nucleotide-binding protein [Candidatus Poribacteria bacterium]MDE0503755.1 nucleotide-binding protein [Candidatus Poribacteria bacterium]